MKVILRTTGHRSRVGLAEAEDIVDRWRVTAEDREVVGVDLSCRPWPLESFLRLKEFLVTEGHNTTVRYLKVDDIIASLLTDEGLEVTAQVADTFREAKIIELDLNDNALGSRGFQRIEPLFTDSPLQVLSLDNCGLSAECMDMLVNYIEQDDGRIAKSLRELHLGRNKIGDGTKTIGTKILPQLINLERFSYRGSRSGNQALHLAQGLLKLVENCPGEPALRHLDLDDGNYGKGQSDDDAIVPLSKALSRCRYLQHLDLGDPSIDNTGLALLVRAFTLSGAKITELLLNGAGALGEEGAEILAEWLVSRASTLKRLHLGYCELGNEGASAILVPFFASQNVLEDLSFECNELDNDFVDVLLMARLPKLKVLNLSDNEDIDDEMKQEQLREKFGEETVLFEMDQEEVEPNRFA